MIDLKKKIRVPESQQNQKINFFSDSKKRDCQGVIHFATQNSALKGKSLDLFSTLYSFFKFKFKKFLLNLIQKNVQIEILPLRSNATVFFFFS
jgi:hypothetical protein